MEDLIALFPLKLVVFPSSKYPLHIFEPRYKKMIHECLQKDMGFGITSKLGQDISNVGCYVKIASVPKRYDNGELDIIVQGVQRFFIDKIELHESGYLIANVNEYNDVDSQVDTSLLFDIRSKFENILRKVNVQLDEEFWNNFINSGTKSFKIAEKSGLTIPEQQELLIIQDENSRLNFLKDHFIKLDEQLAENMMNNDIILNDGFIN